MIDLEEEGLLISFEASGPVDMPWHMAKWGREIEVVEPAGLRKMVEGYDPVRNRVLT